MNDFYWIAGSLALLLSFQLWLHRSGEERIKSLFVEHDIRTKLFMLESISESEYRTQQFVLESISESENRTKLFMLESISESENRTKLFMLESEYRTKLFMLESMADSEFRMKVFIHAEIRSSTERLLVMLHDANNVKIAALSNSSRSSEVCRQSVTAHFVLYKAKVFGISVAHFPCTFPDVPPPFVHACENIDVSIWSGFPPDSVSLLNITGSVVNAKIGDSATAFGYSGNKPRAWRGTIVGELGYNHTGRHYSPDAFDNEKELLFSGTQSLGMSGGGVINGYGYLGLVRAISHDSAGNKLPIVVPFSMFQPCIEKNFPTLEDVNAVFARERHYSIIAVPSSLEF